MYRILLVDDEPNILNALRRCLAAIDVSQLDGDALKIETFSSPEEAIERCEDQDFDLVVSDYRMPTMNGVEFLSRMMELQPNAPRMIISGFADRDAIISAINEASLTRFIEKPWNDQELRRTIVSILGATAKRVGGDRSIGLDASTSAARQRQRMEEESPGITQVERDDDGGIVISLDDLT